MPAMISRHSSPVSLAFWESMFSLRTVLTSADIAKYCRMRPMTKSTMGASGTVSGVRHSRCAVMCLYSRPSSACLCEAS